jgi:hypothetical protein
MCAAPLGFKRPPNPSEPIRSIMILCSPNPWRPVYAHLLVHMPRLCPGFSQAEYCLVWCTGTVP